MPSMERLLELRAAAFADDVEVHAAMLSWDEERLSTYFESGGKASAPPPPQRSLRVLSLHGGGGNRNVNAMQVSRLRRALGPPDVVHFDFLEGDHAWKSENIDPRLVQLFGPGPYWGWYGVENASGHGQNDRDAYVKAMMDPAVAFEYIGYEAALDRLERHISEHGPYDALVGFSQGAIMAPIFPPGGSPLHASPPIARLPAIACMGRQDPFAPYGRQGLGSIYGALEWFEHGGGHETAKEAEVNSEVAEAIWRAVEEHRSSPG
ncbi:hypothetical protein EMIHUDRAFT_197363 [Emiliania huxleyi CCMP1516]|uniref:Serine hydrolase domain-containing protein n=2 Tax=Emiliania huxleyi TaxID=2903 RepID=A0A0D3IU59_EMIH1|nr:hypothetical protein EMIHUDRAFT_197363 [Emiliania huxleyi CCMP1516]EOD14794.1 hypothetical protein EMIHUDRAFT_197363 [Emiliania huxleyi CCMP1516]|eukprot:XP_005767223.1 hypothetical protein EMIHUDRAFT_197363 [Emiliania huxleyi CCMP1516]